MPHSNIFTSDDEKRETYAKKCQTCGACCEYYAQHNFQIPLWPGDNYQGYKKLVQIGRKMKGQSEPVYMRRKVNKAGQSVCAALEGTVGKQVACKIYEQRSEGCSQYHPGSDDCVHARQWAGLE